MRAKEFVIEKWSAKYKRSIDCKRPKGFSQRAHCQGKKKNESITEADLVVRGFSGPTPKEGDWVVGKIGTTVEGQLGQIQKIDPTRNVYRMGAEAEVWWKSHAQTDWTPLKWLKKIGGSKFAEDISETLDENLRDWFGKGKGGGAGGGGWDRYNTKGERIGKCGDRKPGEGKPKCLSKSKAASLRASGGKKAIANAVKRKKAQDKNPNRRGKAKNVKNVAENVENNYDVAEIWASNFIAHGSDMRWMLDLEDDSKISFGEIPSSIQREIERQVGGEILDGEVVTIKQRGKNIDDAKVVVYVPEPIDESSMSHATKKPMGPKFGGYYGATQTGAPKPGQGFGTSESVENDNMKITEVAPPGQEDWIKKNKERFVKQYGKKKGIEVLYATAWKRSKTDEAANWGQHEGHVSKNPVGIPEDANSDLEKKLERAKQRLNAYTEKAPLRDKVKTRQEISDLKKQLGKKD